MIKSVHIKNYILIDDLTVDFSSGLNIITGETGAGKSIVINAIDIAFGSNAGKSILKNNDDKAIIEVFIENKKHDLKNLFEENGVDLSSEIILSKEITSSSSRTRVNGTLVNKDFVKTLRELFLDIHSQHQNYTFIQPKSHIILLDNYANEVYGNELQEYKNTFKDYQDVINTLETSTSIMNDTKNKIDFLQFQIKEIEDAQIDDISEEEKLEQELKKVKNAEKLKELTEQSYYTMNGEDNSLLDGFLKVKTNISQASEMDEDLEETHQAIVDIIELIRDNASFLRDYSQSIEFNPERLNEIQERLYLFDKLKRKYGSTLEEILNTYDNLCKELDEINISEKSINELQKKSIELRTKLETVAKDVSQKRKNYAQVLSSLVTDELEKLELQKSRFEIRITPKELSSDGIDNVEFYISTNVSQDLSPLSETASGGEISRVMLAIKSIFAKSDDIDTVVFDEIDTGISGHAAQSVADEIYELSKYRQVLVITHQAIIASKADRYFLVSKTQNDVTSVEINALSDEEKISALAKMASGEVNETSIKFAKSLIK